MKLRMSLSICTLLIALMIATPIFSHGSSSTANIRHMAPLPFEISAYTEELFCTVTEDWTKESSISEFETLDEISDNGTLTSIDGSFCMTGVADPGTGTAGPLYTMELDTPIPLANLSLFEVDIERVYQFNEFGFLTVYLFDQFRDCVASIRIHDEWQGSESRVDCKWYGSGQLSDEATLETSFLFSWSTTFPH